MSADRPILLAIQHVSWETPHRILDACEGLSVRTVEPLAGNDAADPVIGALAPETSVLHWHGDVFDLPEGAKSLASSARTKHQAFRAGNAWGVLFHPEADSALVDTWLAEPTMADEAQSALGPSAPAELRSQATAAEADLIARSTPGFQAFANLVHSHQESFGPRDGSYPQKCCKSALRIKW